MLVAEFDYRLPAELIAQRPLAARDASRLMLVDRRTGRFEDRTFRELPQLLARSDLLVLNNTRVFPARLLGRRKGVRAQPLSRRNPAAREYLTGKAEVLLTRRESEDTWQALVHPGCKIRPGETVIFGEGELEAEILDRARYGVRRVRLKAKGDLDATIDRLGHVPLPPYIRRPDEPADRNAYQTVYASSRGAVAAPTAGLHFTEKILEDLQARSIERVEITLHVGLATFQPVRVECVEEHRMEPEHYEVSAAAALRINRALEESRRVIAVGTTCVRTLEHVARKNQGRMVAGAGETSLFIRPGFDFKVTQALLTNFHLPKSTLLLLVCAFGGKDLILEAYRHAIEERYRFYSYGDCMLIV